VGRPELAELEGLAVATATCVVLLLASALSRRIRRRSMRVPTLLGLAA
jgi:hypothetical protein